MDDELATTIVERFQAVLAENAMLVSGIPESKLPCDQSMVKDAIKHILGKTSKMDEKFMDLQYAYERLGLFVTDEEVTIIEKAEAALMAEKPDEEGIKCIGKSGAIHEKIQNGMYTLTAELNEFVKKLPDIG